MLSKKLLVAAIATILLVVLIGSCSEHDDPVNITPETELATAWANMTLKTVSKSFPGSPTFTSRNLGYLGLTMYQSVVHGSPVHRSVASQLNGLDGLPEPEAGKEYSWPIALNAGQALMLKSLYGHALPEVIQEISNLEQKKNEAFSKTISDPEIIQRSIAFGQAVASAIYAWSVTDGGHEGHLRNFDPDYVFPSGAGYWIPPIGGQSPSVFPLHPYWGENRTFVKPNSTLPLPEILPYSTSNTSAYYKQFKDVYDKRRSLSREERNIAAWWADDPTQTASPPGHSYNLATQAIIKGNKDIFTAAEVYAKVGMAVADAFINCWKCKYTYHAERPFYYIRAFIDDEYLQFWPEPPFPAFSSGHATQSAATAIVMESVFGTSFPLVDKTYSSRRPDFPGVEYKSRFYANIWETAEECANSRFYGGIHTQQDNAEGQKQGILIGENIATLDWTK
jgi:hypothetical protein